MIQPRANGPNAPLSTRARSARHVVALVALVSVGACELHHTSNGDVVDPADTDVADTVAPATRGLPEGVSSWSGQLDVATFTFLAEATLTNSGGDLTATLTISDSPGAPLGIGTATYTLSGTHDPGSGLVALAPGNWTVVPPFDIELDGFDGHYDPDTDTLVGVVADYASGSDNSLQGGPATLTRTSGDGAATAVAAPTKGLTAGAHTFTGTLQCTGPVRDVSGDLSWDGAGRLTGRMTVGGPDLAAPLGQFDFVGVHNPATGAITLVPKLWIAPDHSTLTFFVDGSYDPSTGRFDGDQRTNTAACPDATWHVVVE